MGLDISEVVFAEATDHQRQLSWTVNGASWAPPMSIEAYIGREQTLSRTALSADGGTRYYVLHLRGDPDTIVAACEVTAKRALVADTAAGVREVRAYAIASVFTPPAFRGSGLASHLLRQVQGAVDAAGAECGALYSDIGRQFYTRLGWRDFRSPQLLLRLEPGFAPLAVPDGEPSVETLDDAAVPDLCAKDIARLRDKFAGLTATGKTHFTFLPTPEQVTWHVTRDTYVAGVMPPAAEDSRTPSSRGVRTADGTAWLLWDHDLREKKLKVLRLVVTRAAGDGAVADARALLRAAAAEAKRWGLPKVLVWSPADETVAAASQLWREARGTLAVVLEEREDGSIPSLRWKGGVTPGEVVWEDNEYYAWC